MPLTDSDSMEDRITLLEHAPKHVGGVGDPNGVQDAPIYSTYDEMDGSNNFVRVWVKGTPKGTLTGWV